MVNPKKRFSKIQHDIEKDDDDDYEDTSVNIVNRSPKLRKAGQPVSSKGYSTGDLVENIQNLLYCCDASIIAISTGLSTISPFNNELKDSTESNASNELTINATLEIILQMIQNQRIKLTAINEFLNDRVF